MPKRKALGEREKHFCMNYLSNGFNAAKAYRDAGYSAKGADVSAVAILKRPHIKAYIDKKVTKMEEKLDITFEWKLKKLKQAIDCSLIESDDGKAELVNTSGFLGAMSELNKMQGDYSAEKRVQVIRDERLEQIQDLVRKYSKEF